MKDVILRIDHQRLREYATAIGCAAGIERQKAFLLADSLVAANLRAVDSHGVQLMIWYVEQIVRGNIDIHANGRVVNESGACLLYDGENALGQVVSAACCDHAIRICREHGMAMVTARESNHFGAAAYWAQRIADAGYLAIVVCNATPLVTPWQGRERKLGTNPICLAVPGPRSFLLDMATTTVALNRIYKASLSGQTEIPEGWALDIDGQPTTSTEKALKGFPMPLGGYKGYGLAMMVEILCAVLSGGVTTSEVGGLRVYDRKMRVGHGFLAIDPARFMPLDEFTSRMQTMIADVKGAAPATGFDEVLVAGDPEWREEDDRRANGVPIAQGIWTELAATAARFGVAVPEL